MTEEWAIPELREMIARFGSLLGQERMYFELADSVVEFIPARVPGGNGS